MCLFKVGHGSQVSRFLLGDFRDRGRDFARSNHSSRGLVLPTSRPTTVSITPQRYPESPGSSRTAHGAAHGASRRTAPTMLLAHLGREIRCFWFKSTLHYSPRLFPTHPSCKRVGTSPASPGSGWRADLILVAGRAAGARGCAHGAAPRRVPIGFS